MDIVKSHIVYKKDFIGGKFVLVHETSDGNYFREIGSGEGMLAHYDQISNSDFNKMSKLYKEKAK